MLIQVADMVRYVEVCPDSWAGGSTYLLLHGMGGSLEQWHEVQASLGRSARVIAVDVPGFGPNRVAGEQFDLHAAADRLLRFCADLDVTGCVLVSHSIGSVVAGLLATGQPERFRRAVFVSGSLFRASEIAQRPLRALRMPRLGTAVAGQFFVGMLPVPPWGRRLVARSPFARQVVLWPFVAHPRRLDGEVVGAALTGSGSPTAVLRILRTAKTIDYVKITSSVRQPVDLIWGEFDRLIADEDLVRMRAAVRVDREYEIPDCGHWAMVEETARVVEFLRAAGQRASIPAQDRYDHSDPETVA